MNLKTGSKPTKVEMDPHRQDVINKLTEKHNNFEDKSNDDAQAAWMTCKLIKDGYPLGSWDEKSNAWRNDGTPFKYATYNKRFFKKNDGPFTSIDDFNEENRSRAEEYAKQWCEKKAQDTKATPAKLYKDMMHGFDDCIICRNRNDGKVEVSSPAPVVLAPVVSAIGPAAPVTAPAPIADAAEPPAKKAKHGTNNHEASSSSDSAPVAIEMNEHSGTIIEELD